MRQISAIQLKTYRRRGCPLHAIQLLNSIESGELKVEDHPVLWEFRDVFAEEVPGLPPKRDLDFSIDLMRGVVPALVPASRVPYRMSAPDLLELKMQLKDMMDKGHIKLTVSPWGEPTLFVKKKDGTLRLCLDY
jgi:hypothetical protein